jgi:hypothetical protein
VCEGEKKGSRRVESSGVIWESKEDKLGSWSTLAGLSMRQSGDDQQWRVCDRTALWRLGGRSITQSSSVSFWKKH